MFPEFIPATASKLTEATSIALAQKIQIAPVTTDFSPKAIDTAYVQQGSGGAPIVLLPGFDSSLLEFRRLLPLLAEQQEAWAVDLLGFGFSDRTITSEIPYNTDAIKTHLYYFWKTYIKQPMILAGASMGGAAAIDFTLTYPDAVAKLVLLDSAGLAKQPVVGKFMFPPLDRWLTNFLRNPKVRQNISQTAYFDKSFASADAQTCAALHLECPDWSKALIAFTKSGGYGSFAKQITSLQQETLILWGKQDKILGTKDAGKFAKLIPQNNLVWIDRCGHVPHLEQPSLTAQEMLAFCL